MKDKTNIKKNNNNGDKNPKVDKNVDPATNTHNEPFDDQVGRNRIVTAEDIDQKPSKEEEIPSVTEAIHPAQAGRNRIVTAKDIVERNGDCNSQNNGVTVIVEENKTDCKPLPDDRPKEEFNAVALQAILEQMVNMEQRMTELQSTVEKVSQRIIDNEPEVSRPFGPVDTSVERKQIKYTARTNLVEKMNIAVKAINKKVEGLDKKGKKITRNDLIDAAVADYLENLP